MALAVDRMEELGLLTKREHGAPDHTHRDVLNRCHETVHPDSEVVVRGHRLAERLFTQTLQVQNEDEIEQQACKFEHILSPEVTERICSFLGHPQTCPHGSPIPAGECCERTGRSQLLPQRPSLTAW